MAYTDPDLARLRIHVLLQRKAQAMRAIEERKVAIENLYKAINEIQDNVAKLDAELETLYLPVAEGE